MFSNWSGSRVIAGTYSELQTSVKHAHGSLNRARSACRTTSFIISNVLDGGGGDWGAIDLKELFGDRCFEFACLLGSPALASAERLNIDAALKHLHGRSRAIAFGQRLDGKRLNV